MIRRMFGFSLIELLIVAAVIAVLTALLLPALAKAREVTTRLVCAEQMRNISLASHSYAMDYGEYFPSAGEALNWGADTYRPWSCKLLQYQYIPNKLIIVNAHMNVEKCRPFLCPKDRNYMPGETAPHAALGKRSYSMGYYVAGCRVATWGIPSTHKPPRLSAIGNPSKVVLYGENVGGRNYLLWGSAFGYYILRGPTPGWWGTIVFPHLRKSNVIFVDGHLDSRGYNEFNDVTIL